MTPITSGHPDSPLWIVGEAPGAEEIQQGRPFVGTSGYLLRQLLAETGFSPNEMFITNVCHTRPPGNDIEAFFYNKTLAKQNKIPLLEGRYPLEPVATGYHYLRDIVAKSKPQQIIALGGTALWALTGRMGILKWRGSHLTTNIPDCPPIKVIPTVHPAAVLRQWELRFLALTDLRRAKRESFFPEVRKPAWSFITRPSLFEVVAWADRIIHLLNRGPLYLAVDIETRQRQIACIGVADSPLNAICIPLLCSTNQAGYWSAQEEEIVIKHLHAIFTHPNAQLIFQNGAYDLQYFIHQYGFTPRLTDDTMVMQHVAFPGMRKGLDFLSSLYCEYHRYWKDDGKEWQYTLDDELHWQYNAEDCVRTFEIFERLSTILRATNRLPQYHFQIRELFPIVLRMMVRGIRTDLEAKKRFSADLDNYVKEAEDWLEAVLGHRLNVRSPAQMQRLFYDDLRVKPIFDRKTKKPTLNDDALETIERRNPLLVPLISVIRDIRSAGTVRSNVLEARISSDGRSRSTINITGAKTFRFSSSEDAFGDGFNLQNLTTGDEE